MSKSKRARSIKARSASQIRSKAATRKSAGIHFGGWVETTISPAGVKRSMWHPAETLEAVAYDIPIVGWRGRHVNPLRLWSARAVDPLRLDAFNMGDHVGALSEQTRAEAISKILYPSDATPAGQEFRLRQEYFFVSASLQDLVQRHLRTDGNWPAPGSEDTELGVLMELEVGYGETEVHAGIQA